MAYNLEEFCNEDDYPRDPEDEKFAHLEQRQITDGLRTSSLSGSGQQRMLLLIQALQFMFGTSAAAGNSIIARSMCVRFKLRHSRGWSSAASNSVTTDFQSRVIIAIVKGRITPSVPGNDTVQFNRFFTSATNPVHAFLLEEARDQIEVVYDSTFSGSGVHHGIYDSNSVVSGTFGGGGGFLVDGTGDINPNDGSISTVVNTTQVKYFPVCSTEKEVSIDLMDQQIVKQACAEGAGYPNPTSTERLNLYYVMWHVTGINPAEASYPSWTSDLYFDTNFVYEDD